MEQFLYHVWKHALYDNKPPLRSTSGVELEVIDPGVCNPGVGPDFFNAKIRYGGEMWAGNVEIHVRSSDWYCHQHDSNPAYDSVILSVVVEADCPVSRTTGENIDQLELAISDRLIEDYSRLALKPANHSACPFNLSELNPLCIADWIGSLGMERLIDKARRVQELVDLNAGNWEEALYILLARSFGTGVNADPFERLARSLPLMYLRKHGSSLLQMEAMLFGQAGLLESQNIMHPYYLQLKQEYAFLARKFSLTPLPAVMWNFARLRPAAFPQIRIAAFAALLHRHQRLFSLFTNAPDTAALRRIFDVKLSPFWDDHYRFGAASGERVKQTGLLTIDTILINTLAPLLFAYGAHTGNYRLEERAVSFLESLRPENNMYVRAWAGCGITARSAFDSQALLQLQRGYCEQKKCLYCRFGHQLLKRKA
jgi:hypothetical protein